MLTALISKLHILGKIVGLGLRVSETETLGYAEDREGWGKNVVLLILAGFSWKSYPIYVRRYLPFSL